MIYEPREDTFLIAKEVEKHAKGEVLDMGTGSGYLAGTAAKLAAVTKVIGVDISDEAIDYCKEHISSEKARFLQSDLFSVFFSKGRHTFDTIIFNPPYLPDDQGVKDAAIDGGKKGHEVIERFLRDSKIYLADGGIILLLFSSLTGRADVERVISENLLEGEELAREKHSFEELYVYRITKSNVLAKLHRNQVSGIWYVTKGKRGLILQARYNGTKVSIKAANPKSKAVGRIANEANFLKILNAKGIGPRLIAADSEGDYLVMEFVEGVPFESFLEKAGRKDNRKIKGIIADIFTQMLAIDAESISKEEMHHPHKHIIITKGNKPVLLDFERCHKTERPSNVTQCCQYIISLEKRLTEKGIIIHKERIIILAKAYRNHPDKKIVDEILSGIQCH